ncbi:ribosome-recycling factor, mitochondrial [Musca vetustissima]|uniref:ribosome-recycling factor, mitochondrial n=1 Tax=Musca vetustissima TaxID=27455 RepID=UPI002AB7843E|nr:ribosome-recycling factor, mitochondrial [Musca vetustissima]
MFTRKSALLIQNIIRSQVPALNKAAGRSTTLASSSVWPISLQKASIATTECCYAKNKDKKKEKGKKAAKVEINETLLRDIINYDAVNAQMQKAVQQMKDDFIKHLSLRSTTGAIDTLRVTVDGTEHELQELAQISRKNPKTIVVNMIAFPQTIPDVLKALEKSGMNLNPQQDGTTLFIPIPKVTKEHRENLSKNAKNLFIKYRDSIKDIQNNCIKKVKKQTEISKDDVFSVQTQITAIADKYIAEAEKILQAKQKELLGDS